TYVYCLVIALRKPSLRGVPKGLAGTGPVRLLAVEQEPKKTRRAKTTDRGQWLVVSDAPLDEHGADSINRRMSNLEWVGRAAVAHEAVVEFFSAAAAPLPMKLFTIFSNDERAVEDFTRRRREIAALAARVSNHQEWGLRVAFSPQRRTPSRS